MYQSARAGLKSGVNVNPSWSFIWSLRLNIVCKFNILLCIDIRENQILNNLSGNCKNYLISSVQLAYYFK